jgi:hypothetical protein
MRLLVAVAPIMYLQTLAYVIRTNRPNGEVHLADPQALDRERLRFGPT